MMLVTESIWIESGSFRVAINM